MMLTLVSISQSPTVNFKGFAIVGGILTRLALIAEADTCWRAPF